MSTAIRAILLHAGFTVAEATARATGEWQWDVRDTGRCLVSVCDVAFIPAECVMLDVTSHDMTGQNFVHGIRRPPTVSFFVAAQSVAATLLPLGDIVTLCGHGPSSERITIPVMVRAAMPDFALDMYRVDAVVTGVPDWSTDCSEEAIPRVRALQRQAVARPPRPAVVARRAIELSGLIEED